MKVLGPKVWSHVPESAKLLPFRKNFSKHMKRTFLDNLPKDRRTKIIKHQKAKDAGFDNLKLIFETDDPDEEFLGFSRNDLAGFDNLRLIFENDDQDKEFLGFSRNDFSQMETIFETNMEGESDYVSSLSNDMANLFETTHDSDETFHGF